MSRRVTWKDKGGGLRQRIVTTERTKEEWRKRLALMNTKVQRCSIIRAYRRWLKEQ